MLPWDVRNFSDEQREKMAARIRVSQDFNLPRLDMWNYDPCRQHANGWIEEYFDEETQTEKKRTVFDRPKPGCRKCGIIFRRHQRVGIAWLYMKKRGLLADYMGPQPLSSPVLTPTGWVAMGDLSEGDTVVAPEGGRSEVVKVHDRGVQPVYRVTFSDGSSTEASGTHLWEVTTPSRKYQGLASMVLTTDELVERGLQHASGNYKWYIPMTSPVEFESADELPLDPYLVGVLLGDGSLSQHSVFLSTDIEIVETLVLPEGCKVTTKGRSTAEYHDDFRITGLKPHIDALNMSVTSKDKGIPSQYLWGSVKTRESVLQGLLDTDGSPTTSRGDSSSGVEYGTVSRQLAEDVKFLVESLGGTASISVKESPAYEYAGERRYGQSYYRMYLRLPNYFVPFRLKRKLDRWTPRTKYNPTRAITHVEYVRHEPVRCIEVSAKSHTYLTNNFIVTHNSGKTAHAGGLIAMLHQTGEIQSEGRVIVVPRAPALGQWQAELLRMMPRLNLVMATGTKRQRHMLYAQPWDVLLISPQTLNNDREIIENNFDLSALITDDVDALRNHETETAYTLKRLGRKADRMVVMTGTPVQKKLRELWSTLDPIGGLEAFGPLNSFERRHITTTTIREFDERTGLQTRVRTVPAYRNMREVKEKMAPMVLRRKIEDLVDVNLPAVNVNDVFLDLYPAQKNKYDELRRGVLRIIKEQGEDVKFVTALTQIHYGSQICGGLATLGEPDGPNTSVKMDWILEKLTGELEGEKVVLFANYKNSVRALQDRFNRAGIGFVTVWGEDPSRESRLASQNRFWDDPNCRVLIGTQAIEQSLNLQVARHLINMDMILNPSRMAQLAGRIRRDGSAHKHIFVHNLLTAGTQEERYLPLLEREAALSDFVWDESNDLFAQLNPLTLLQLISG